MTKVPVSSLVDRELRVRAPLGSFAIAALLAVAVAAVRLPLAGLAVAFGCVVTAGGWLARRGSRRRERDVATALVSSAPPGPARAPWRRSCWVSWTPPRGKVLVGGMPARNVRLDDVRGRSGLVDDDPHVFATTLVENIRLARPTASDAEVEEREAGRRSPEPTTSRARTVEEVPDVGPPSHVTVAPADVPAPQEGWSHEDLVRRPRARDDHGHLPPLRRSARMGG